MGRQKRMHLQRQVREAEEREGGAAASKAGEEEEAECYQEVEAIEKRSLT